MLAFYPIFLWPISKLYLYVPLNCICVRIRIVNGARTKDGVALGHAALTPEIVFHLVSLWLTKDTCAEAEDPETKDRPVYPCTKLVWMSLMWMQSNSNQICCLNCLQNMLRDVWESENCFQCETNRVESTKKHSLY